MWQVNLFGLMTDAT